MSISIASLDTVRVLDPRTDVNSLARRTYRILDGPQDSGYQRVRADGTAGTNSVFNINPPSSRVFVNRHLLVEYKVRLTFKGVITGGGAAGRTLLRAAGLPKATGVEANFDGVDYGIAVTEKGDAPRAYPLANAMQSCQVSINQDRISVPVGSFWRAMTRYNNDFDQQRLDQSLTPTFLDQTQDYPASGAMNGSRSPFGDYDDSSDVIPRGGWQNCVILRNDMTGAYKRIGNPAGADVGVANGTELTSIVELTVCEPLFISPFLYQRNSQSTGLIGVQTMQAQLNLAGRSSIPDGGLAAMFWSHTPNQANTYAVVSATAEVLDAAIYVNYLTPDMTQEIPLTNHYSYAEPIVYSSDVRSLPTAVVPAAPGVAIPPATPQNIYFNNIQLNSIPSRVYIFASKADNAHSISTPDTFGWIQSLNISFDNRDALLSAAQPRDLYNIAVKNGVNVSWDQWSHHTGSVMALDFGEDIPLRPTQAPGLRGSFNLRVQAAVSNESAATADFQLFLVIMGVGVMTISNGNVVRSVGVLDVQNILASKDQAALPWSPAGDIYGGGVWDDIKGMFGKFMKFAKPFAAKAAMAAPIIAPEFAPYVSGASSLLNTIGDMTGTGLVGGKKVSRAQLKKMLKN
jgi:hypothetical protein